MLPLLRGGQRREPHVGRAVVNTLEAGPETAAAQTQSRPHEPAPLSSRAGWASEARSLARAERGSYCYVSMNHTQHPIIHLQGAHTETRGLAADTSSRVPTGQAPGQEPCRSSLAKPALRSGRWSRSLAGHAQPTASAVPQPLQDHHALHQRRTVLHQTPKASRWAPEPSLVPAHRTQPSD